MTKPSISEVVTIHNGTTFLWLREPFDPPGYYYMSGEDCDQKPSIAHWSGRYDSFEDAEKDAIAEQARSDERAKKKKR